MRVSVNWLKDFVDIDISPHELAERLTMTGLEIDKVHDRAKDLEGFVVGRVVEAKKQGAKLIVIDPRRTRTAEMADLWLQIRPGTDAALAMAMMNVMINEQLYDGEFVEKWTVGFDKLQFGFVVTRSQRLSRTDIDTGVTNCAACLLDIGCAE